MAPPPKKPTGDQASEQSANGFGEDDELPMIWVYGVNDHLDRPDELPADFPLTGAVTTDFRGLCQVMGAVPHPAFKERKSPEKPQVRSRRPSLLNPSPNIVEEPELPKEPPVLSIRSILLDSLSMHIFSLLLPHAVHLKAIIISDCRLDCEMLKLLRAGLEGDCSVESLQIEWNPFELPLLSLEEPSPGQLGEGAAAEAAGDGSSTTPAGESREFERRERCRYLAQSHRHLRCFREYLESRFGGNLENAWTRLSDDSVDVDALLSVGEFHDVLEARLGVKGPQTMEVFEVLDGPDYAAGQACVSLSALRAALEGLPEEPAEQGVEDPIGLTLAAFVDGECILESLSLRACALGRLEVGPLSEAIKRCPWQLRCLNLWDNRVCDTGAELLGAALTVYRGLEYLGLGKNRLTQVGMLSVVKPFQTEVINEAKYRELQDGVPKVDPKAAKAKAKPKAKAESRRDSASRRGSVRGAQARVLREAPNASDEFEEVPGDPPTWILRRPTELRTLTLSDNPISGVDVVEALQPNGPRGAELVLRGTPVGAALAAKRPELVCKPRPPGLLPGALAGPPNVPMAPPPGDGWVLRVN